VRRARRPELGRRDRGGGGRTLPYRRPARTRPRSPPGSRSPARAANPLARRVLARAAAVLRGRDARPTVEVYRDAADAVGLSSWIDARRLRAASARRLETDVAGSFLSRPGVRAGLRLAALTLRPLENIFPFPPLNYSRSRRRPRALPRARARTELPDVLVRVALAVAALAAALAHFLARAWPLVLPCPAILTVGRISPSSATPPFDVPTRDGDLPVGRSTLRPACREGAVRSPKPHEDDSSSLLRIAAGATLR